MKRLKTNTLSLFFLQKSLLSLITVVLLVSPAIGMGHYQTIRDGNSYTTYYTSGSHYPAYYSRSLAPTAYYNDIVSYRSSDTQIQSNTNIAQNALVEGT